VPSQPLTFPLNITNNDSWVSDNEDRYDPPDGPIAHYNSVVIPEFPSAAILSILKVLTLIITAYAKRRFRDLNFTEH